MINTFGLDVLNYAAAEQAMFTKMMANDFNYKTISTFWGDLSIAETFGAASVEDTFNRVCKGWMNDTKMFTEFVLALNHKSWEHSARKQPEMCALYSKLYYLADKMVYDKWNKEQRVYYFSVTD